MKCTSNTVIILFAMCALLIHANGKDEPPEDAKKSFLDGMARLNEEKSAFFNEQTLPGLKPIKDILITSNFERSFATRELEGVVRVRIRVSNDSGHVKIFWFSLRDGKWIIKRWAKEPWEKDKPPKVSITDKETEQFVEKVQACFSEK